jgi:hypothetical protein
VGKNTVRQALEKVVINKIRDDPNWGIIIAEVFSRMNEGFWSQWYLDMIFQHFMGFDFYDAYLFACIHAEICQRYTITEIPLGFGPRGDRFEKENNELLAKLPEGYSGRFIGGKGYSDGSIRVSYPILPTTKEDPHIFPLEVGYTKIDTTWEHLFMRSQQLARWPYNSKSVFLIY